MSFTNDLDSSIGQVRFLLGDDREHAGILLDGRNLSDEQIQFVLTSNSSHVHRTVIALCEVLATQYAQLADTTLGPHMQTASQVSKAFARRATELRRTYGVSQRAISVPTIKLDGYSQDIPSDQIEES